jgi:hypothetical protein
MIPVNHSGEDYSQWICVALCGQHHWKGDGYALVRAAERTRVHSWATKVVQEDVGCTLSEI